jgi:hypothetical protein
MRPPQTTPWFHYGRGAAHAAAAKRGAALVKNELVERIPGRIEAIINPHPFQTSMTIPPRYESRPAHYQLTTARDAVRPSCSPANKTVVDVQERAFQMSADDWERGQKYQTKSGIRVRSKIEKIIADFLFHEKVRFVYEPRVCLGGQAIRPDFYLPDYNLFYEHFGRADELYQRAAAAKVARYHQAAVPFMYTTADDEPDIEDVIVDQLAAATLGL